MGKKELELTEFLICTDRLLDSEITSCSKYVGPPPKFAPHLPDSNYPYFAGVLFRSRQLGQTPPGNRFFQLNRVSHLLLAYEQWVDTVFLLMYRQLVTVNKVQVKYLQ